MILKKKPPLFYIIYFSVVAVALVAIIFGLVWLRGYLAEYESARPYVTADEVFDKYFAKGDFAEIVKNTHDSDSFESADDITLFLNEKYGGADLTYDSVSSGGDDSIQKYVVKADDRKIAEFTLKKSGNKTKRGFELYEKDSFKLYYPANESVTVLVPEGSSVYVNGKELNEKYIADGGVMIVDESTLPEGLTPMKYTRYTVSGLVNVPSVKVMTNGIENPPEYDEKAGEHISLFPSDSSLETEHKEFVMAALREYAKYMGNDSWWGAVSPYFDPTTDLYTSLDTVENYFVIPHTGYRFEDEFAGEFYSYDEDTFSCRVSLTHVLENTDKEDFKDRLDVTIYLRRVGDKFLIYHWNVNNE